VRFPVDEYCIGRVSSALWGKPTWPQPNSRVTSRHLSLPLVSFMSFRSASSAIRFLPVLTVEVDDVPLSIAAAMALG
jgi:hypothetical protein